MYSFLATERFLEARVESVTSLDEVRGPSAAIFGPERGRFAGSLWMATSNLRNGSLSRVYPDTFGVFSPQSRVESFDPSRSLNGTVGMAFGPDEALYIASDVNQAVYRVGLDTDGTPRPLQKVASVPAALEGIAGGYDGAIYFIESLRYESTLWQIGFTPSLSPREPRVIATLSGRASGLAKDPLSGYLFALVEERMGDTVVVELPPWWLKNPEHRPPTRRFSLTQFREETIDGPIERPLHLDNVSPLVCAVRLPAWLIPERLDFMAFDSLGLMYLASRENDLVLQFDLDRRDDERNAVGIAAVTTSGPGNARQVRLHTWKKRRLGT